MTVKKIYQKTQVEKHIRNLNIKKHTIICTQDLMTQVLSADIQYNAGQVLLVPGAGSMGDLSTSSNNQRQV